MSLLRRFTTTLNAKANELFDRLDNPIEALEYAYELERDQLAKVKRAIERVAELKERLRIEMDLLRASSTALDQQAREQLSLGKETLAREALARWTVVESGVASLGVKRDELAAEDDRFVEAQGLLEAKIEYLRTQKEVLKASYAANGTRTEIETATSQIRREIEDIRSAVERAEDNVAQLGARSTVIDELLASGALHDLSRSPAWIEPEVRQARGSAAVERQLAHLKGTTH